MIRNLSPISKKLSDISIIIPVFNEEKYIIKCLESIAKTGIKDVYIEDANSSDETVKLIRNFKSDLNIRLFTNNFKKPPYDSLYFLISKVQTNWFYFIGADDTLDALTFKNAKKEINDSYSYHIPLMEFWSENKGKSLGIYPQKDFISGINSANSRFELVKVFIDYGTLDMLVLGIHRKAIPLWCYENLKVHSKEGINFWQVLVTLLINNSYPKITTSKDPALLKIFDQIYPSGDQHPENDRVNKQDFFSLVKYTMNSLFNIFVVTLKFKLSLNIIFLLLFRKRGLKNKIRPACKAPLDLSSVFKKFLK